AATVDTAEPLPPLRLIAGAHVAYTGDQPVAAVVVLTFPALEVVARAAAIGHAPFPYVPGLLAFRELPTLLAACEQLSPDPDLVLCDAHGIAHPCRFGLASHLGYCLDVPSVGCARRRFVGEHGPVGEPRGSWVWLTDGGQRVGVVARTRTGVKPVFVSPGFAVTVSDAVEIVLATTAGYRMRAASVTASIVRTSSISRAVAASLVTSAPIASARSTSGRSASAGGVASMACADRMTVRPAARARGTSSVASAVEAISMSIASACASPAT